MITYCTATPPIVQNLHWIQIEEMDDETVKKLDIFDNVTLLKLLVNCIFFLIATAAHHLIS